METGEYLFPEQFHEEPDITKIPTITTAQGTTAALLYTKDGDGKEGIICFNYDDITFSGGRCRVSESSRVECCPFEAEVAEGVEVRLGGLDGKFISENTQSVPWTDICSTYDESCSYKYTPTPQGQGPGPTADPD